MAFFVEIKFLMSQNKTQIELLAISKSMNCWILPLKFDLIMISDRMDESLILMKNELDLSLEDILYFTMNRR